MFQAFHQPGCPDADSQLAHTCPSCGFAHADCAQPDRLCWPGCADEPNIADDEDRREASQTP